MTYVCRYVPMSIECKAASIDSGRSDRRYQSLVEKLADCQEAPWGTMSSAQMQLPSITTTAQFWSYLLSLIHI